MPLFYFDISQDNLVEEDHQGKRAADLGAAKELAAKVASEFLLEKGKAAAAAVIEVRDERRELLASVPVKFNTARNKNQSATRR